MYLALLNGLNARAIDFGEKITYNKIQSLIYSADTRILGASIYGLDDVDFNTGVIYWTPYDSVPYYLELPESAQIGDYGVCASGVNYQLYQYNKVGDQQQWVAKVNSVPVTPVTKLYSLPKLDDTNAFVGVYSEDSSWNARTITPSGVSGSVYCCISQPNSSYLPSSPDMTICKIIIKATSDDSDQIISTYPSTPVELSGWDAMTVDGQIVYGTTFKYLGVSHIAILDTVGWQYGEAVSFYYAPTMASDAVGSFLEEYVSSEINDDGKYDERFAIGNAGKGKLRGDFQTEIYAKTVLSGNASIYDTNFKFSPRMQDSAPQSPDNIYFVEPSLTLELKSEYRLQDNEYVQVLTPEFETIANYSFYVYMGYYNSNTESAVQSIAISANQNYELSDNEYVVFYYRSDDDEKYQYTVFKGDGIYICPSKTIVLYNLSMQRQICNINDGNTKSGICPSSLNVLVEQSTKSTTPTQNRLTFLKSQDSCDVKRIIRNWIDGYTFVSNTFDSKKSAYTMSFTDGYRVLEEGESLSVYKYEGDTPILDSIVGAGTIIYILPKTVDVIESAVVNGVQSPKKTSETNFSLSYIGAEITQLSPKTYIRPIFTAIAELDSISFIPTSNSSAYDNVDDYIERVSVKASNICGDYAGTSPYGNLANVNDGTTYNSSWAYWNALTEYITSAIQSEDWSSYEGNTATIQVEYINQKKNGSTIENINNHYFSLNYEITAQKSLVLNNQFEKYTTKPIITCRNDGDTSYTRIPQTIGNEFDVLVRAALMIDINSGESQLLTPEQTLYNNTSKQSAKFYAQDGVTEILDTSKVGIQGDKCLLSVDADVTALGGKQQLGSAATVYYASEEKGVKNLLDSNNQIVGDITYDEYSTTISINPSSTAIVPMPNIVNGSGYILYGRVLDSDSTITVKYSDDSYVADFYGVEFISKLIKINGNFSFNINKGGSVSIQNHSATNYLNLSIDAKMVSYREKAELVRDDNGTPIDATPVILAKMGTIDTKREFVLRSNYDYPISNPIAAASFLNKNHPYNPYTICMMNGVTWRS